MRKLIIAKSLLITALITAPSILAQTDDVAKVENFMQNIIQTLVTLAGVLAALFFVWGGLGYITSSGNPESLEKSKKTIFYSGMGLAISLAAYVLSNVVTQLAQGAFGG